MHNITSVITTSTRNDMATPTVTPPLLPSWPTDMPPTTLNDTGEHNDITNGNDDTVVVNIIVIHTHTHTTL